MEVVDVRKLDKFTKGFQTAHYTIYLRFWTQLNIRNEHIEILDICENSVLNNEVFSN
jgi:hypothetical protein